MKKKILKLIALLLVLAGIFHSCDKNEINQPNNPIEKNDPPFLSDSVYYVAGYNACSGVLDNHDGTAKAGSYLFISENLKDTLFASNLDWLDEEHEYWEIGNLLDSLFTFPIEILPTNIAGFNFFPLEYRFAYRVQISYRPMTEEEERDAAYICFTLYHMPYPFLKPKYIVITSISKIQ